MSEDINKELTLEEKLSNSRVKEVEITTEMKKSFLEYSMSVIVSRALPDIRDGLKPVQRRIIYGMNELNITSDKPHKKCARIVGDVMGKYHPHGDSSIYEALVRMAQDFSYNETLIDGHGNFGSIDGDEAAAMRYTEARLSKVSNEMIRDIDSNTVDFMENYDASEKEPVVLPSRFPNLLVNGSMGIAVGMATNIPPHNLGETINGFLAYMDNPDITTLELMEYIKGPDFPTGAQIIGLSGLRNAYENGRGSILIKSKAEIVEKNGKSSIIITEIPYQVNKTRLLDRIAEVAKNKIIEGITDLNDESSMKGMRIVVDLKKDRTIEPEVILNQLYKHTQLQVSYGINMVCIVNGEPKTVSLIDIFKNYLEFQIQIINRRTKFYLEKALARIHILEALVTVLNDIDNVIRIIKENKTQDAAGAELKVVYSFDDIQVKAILAYRLGGLAGLEIEKIVKEYNEILLEIEEYRAIIVSDDLKKEIIRKEITEISLKYSNPRKTIITLSDDLDIEDEDLIPVQDIVVTVTHNGYAKRMNVDDYKVQGRGGKGVKGINIYEDDFVEHLLFSNTHTDHLFFTTDGQVYKTRGYKIPSGVRASKGIPLQNLLSFDKEQKLASIVTISDYSDITHTLIFVTKKGIIKKSSLSEYERIAKTGKIAINIKEGDELLTVLVSDGTKDVILASTDNLINRFTEDSLKVQGRNTAGVIGKRFKNKENSVIDATLVGEYDKLISISENGFGKISLSSDYRTSARGSLGVKALPGNQKSGNLAGVKLVKENSDIIIITDKGVVIRTPLEKISSSGRAALGVKIIRMSEDQKVSNIIVVPSYETEEIAVDEANV
ncbi:MAG: DNA gyrase subunit A [Acholeplasmatales bacterium]|jgi:DNA gyrase subunit A|nr:DNA gyrase subunit A [Acholeplasmatales bacterium]